MEKRAKNDRRGFGYANITTIGTEIDHSETQEEETDQHQPVVDDGSETAEAISAEPDQAQLVLKLLAEQDHELLDFVKALSINALSQREDGPMPQPTMTPCKYWGQLPIINMNVENMATANTLLDTGAQRSLMNADLFKRVSSTWTHEKQTMRRNEQTVRLVSATGDELVPVGSYHVLVSIQGLMFLHEFMIVETRETKGPPFRDVDIILGIDFLRKNQASLCTRTNTLYLRNQEIRLQEEMEPVDERVFMVNEAVPTCPKDYIDVQFREDVWVAARASTVTQVRWQARGAYEGGRVEPQLIEPWDLQVEDGPAMPQAELGTPRGEDEEMNLWPLAITNPSAEERLVRAGTTYVLSINLGRDQQETGSTDEQMTTTRGGNEPVVPEVSLTPTETSQTLRSAEETAEWERIADEVVRQSNVLTTEEQEQLRTILAEFQDVFRLKNDPPGEATYPPIRVELSSQVPIYLKQYQLTDEDEKEADKQVKKMLECGIIEPSTSPWNFPVLFVNKKVISKEGTIIPERRMCVDLRELNERTKPINFPIPTVDHTINKLKGSRYFSCLDILSGFWHLPMEAESRQYLAFSTDTGHYQFRKMPFGWSSAPFYFQRFTQIYVANECSHCCRAYIDDLVIYSKTLQEHFQHLREVLLVIRKNNIRLKMSKCSFFTQEMEYLGHIITQDGIRKDPRKLMVIKNVPPPHNKKQLRSFLGKINYYGKFIPHLAQIAKPLTKLTGSKREFTWHEEQQVAYEALKRLIAEDVMLMFPDVTKPYNVTTDASDYAIGAVLSQTDEESKLERPILFISKSLDETQTRYSVTEKELYAIIYALEKFRAHIYGKEFYVYTDHRALLWLCGKKDVSGRLARWSYKISEYARSIRFIQGKQNKVADALSRAPFQAEPVKDYETDQLMGNPCLTDQLKEAIYETAGIGMVVTRHAARMIQQEQDANLEEKQELLAIPQEDSADSGEPEAIVTDGEAGLDPIQVSLSPTLMPYLWSKDPSGNHEPNVSRNAQGLWITHQRDTAEELLSGSEESEKLWVPPRYRQEVMRAYHWNPTAAHPSRDRMYQNIFQEVWWKGCRDNISEYVRSCNVCQLNKTGRNPKIMIQPRQNANRPMQRVSLDVFFLPNTAHQGYPAAVLVILDEFTRYAFVEPLKNQLAETVADVFFDTFVMKHGPPAEIITDRGANFLSEIFTRLCEQMQAEKINTTAYHPQANGANERMHATLYVILRNLTNQSGSDWRKRLTMAVYVYNTSYHQALQMCPYRAVHGYNVRQVSLDFYRPEFETDLDERIANLREVHAWIMTNMQNAQDKRNEALNQTRTVPEFYPGQLVKFMRHVRSKLQAKWIGPVTILKKLGTVDYLLDLSTVSNRIHPVLHVSYLRPWYKPKDLKGDNSDDSEEDESAGTAAGAEDNLH